ncbi:ATP-binding protein [Motiliproteus sp. MSK22-1]|uniref:ATP-binding protein n=1 Tax=Motiliproteus sp. MSK22-1 TaxID=1897630 RepID=UPI00097614A7|nr:ATP-binding protein [Motiliproteus sp. MSK22-1]OMH33926.1 hypothetical protein BGP75_13220 [Motiliproteus sp. MSK22-1]
MTRHVRISPSFRWYPLLLVALPLFTLLLVVFSFQTIEQTRHLAVDSATQVADEVSHMMREQSLLVAQEQLTEVAKTTALQAQGKVERAISVASTLAKVLSGMRQADVAVDVGRDSVNSILKILLKSNSDFLAAYSIWEPDAFDMLDLAYANAPGHDDTGRFVPYWYRDELGSIELIPTRNYRVPLSKRALLDPGVIGPGDFYQRVKKTLSPIVLAPWSRQLNEKDVLVISVVIPILVDQRFLGVAGVDLPVQMLQQLVDHLASEILPEDGQLTVLSDAGSVVAKSVSDKNSKDATDVSIHSDHELVQKIIAGVPFRELDEDTLRVLQPLKFGEGFLSWGVYLSLPRSQVEVGASSIHQKMMADVRQVEQFLNEKSKTGLWRQAAIIIALILFALLIYRLMRSLERKERALRQSEGRLQALLDNTTAVIYMKDLNGRYLMVNRRWLELFHVSTDQVLGHTDFELFSAEVAEKFRANDMYALRQQKTVEIEEAAPQDDGLHTYISLKFPLFDAKGQCYATCGISTDITERKKAEEVVQQLNADLEHRVFDRTQELSESLASLKSAQAQLVQSEKMAALGDLVGGIAHEVNTPLGNALTAASSLQETVEGLSSLYQKQKMTRSDLEYFLDHNNESAEILMTNLHRAVELIENFKEVSVDQSHVELRSFDVKDYLEKVLQSLKPKFKHTNHELVLDCPYSIEVTLYPGAFAQIISNLVMNSLIHGFDGIQSGRVDLKVRSDSNYLLLDYHDNGCGIEPDVLLRIYEPFVTTKRGKGGSGLGMNIVYNLVTRCPGGDIECRSSPGEGVHIRIRLPLVLQDDEYR